MTTPAQLYANEKVEWGSPEWMVKAAHKALGGFYPSVQPGTLYNGVWHVGNGGGIDLDPASSWEFNKRVRAKHIFTEKDNGLNTDWCQWWSRFPSAPSRVFLNPPGRLVNEFWAKLMTEYEAGHVSSALWVGFNLDHLRYLSEHKKWPPDFSTMIPRKRGKFVSEAGVEGSRPSCANYLTFVGSQATFLDAFGEYGRLL